ncbi:LysR family transcriptional regulator [Rarobacter incanus]|uniref:DNA-binding transcriptional LysR family regulator n=1 Tax=Rarobacter incanus TaxID=153494 RepID=A0A542SSJ0_9MICO|nr:LysR family transcriptional regulator [Rarobacter incanus]TQK77237.1 DNA-binding transcriptional LysR family regulator [Rarobacter incanus]
MAEEIGRTSLVGLHVIAAVDECGSISAAARSLSISQPAASVALRRLEKRVGVRLLDRTPRGSALTENGRAVAAWARNVLGAMEEFDTAVAALSAKHAERVRVAASMTIAEYLAPQWLAALSAVRPTTDVELVVRNSFDVMDLVLAGDIEVGFVEGTNIARGLRSRVVARDELVAVVGAHHPAARRQAIGADELLCAGLIVREVGSGTRQVLEEALAKTGLALSPHTPCLGSTAAVKSAVRYGESVAVLSRLAVADELDRGVLVPLEVLGIGLVRKLRMVWRADAVLGPAAAQLAAIAARGNVHPGRAGRFAHRG